MIHLSDGSGFPLEWLVELLGGNCDGDIAAKASRPCRRV